VALRITESVQEANDSIESKHQRVYFFPLPEAYDSSQVFSIREPD